MPIAAASKVTTRHDPAQSAVAVTPDDSTILSPYSRGLWIGTGGDLAVVMASGDAVTFSSVPGGVLLPLQVSKVMATGTSASAIVAVS